MITKRLAIRAIFMGVLAKMAHADEPPTKRPGDSWQSIDTTTGWMLSDFNKPNSWTVNLDNMTALHVWKDGKEIVITAEDIFEALKD